MKSAILTHMQETEGHLPICNLINYETKNVVWEIQISVVFVLLVGWLVCLGYRTSICASSFQSTRLPISQGQKFFLVLLITLHLWFTIFSVHLRESWYLCYRSEKSFYECNFEKVYFEDEKMERISVSN